MEICMRQLLHYPPRIPDEPLFLRRIYLPPNNAPRQDELVPLDWGDNTVTLESVDAFLREDLKISGAHGIRIETEDGGFVREHTVWHVVRERLGIERALLIGERERVQKLLPDLPPM
jgi:hypothetical protein